MYGLFIIPYGAFAFFLKRKTFSNCKLFEKCYPLNLLLFCRRKKVIQLWNDMRQSKWLNKFHFGLNCPFKWELFFLFTFAAEQMPTVACSFSRDDGPGGHNYLFIRKCKPPRSLSVITVVFIIVSEGNLILHHNSSEGHNLSMSLIAN